MKSVWRAGKRRAGKRPSTARSDLPSLSFVSARHLLCILVPLLSACSPTYVVRAAYEQGKILLARRQIEKVLADETTSVDDREKLAYVLKARDFGASIGLTPGDSFTAYSDVGKETLAWVVVASKKDAFVPYTWWFPIVGTVPYKGFFDQQDARDQARHLEEKGYESSVRGTEAFSTLGWFNDPVLSTTLRNPTFKIVNTVLHESVHATVWIPGNVPFNETLASFVAAQATVQFFQHELIKLPPPDPRQGSLQSLLDASERDRAFQSEFATIMTTLYTSLNTLYSDTGLSSEQKIAKRSEIFNATMTPFREKYPRMTTLSTINNAEIMQFTIYMTKYNLFEELFAQVNGSWSDFFQRIQKIQKTVEQKPLKDPFDMLLTSSESSPT